MTLVATRVPRIRSPLPMVVTISLLLFLGVTALAGGVALTFGLGEGELMAPAEWLEDIPLIDSWVVPGLVLGVGFGLGSLLAAFGMLRRPRWRWAAPIERVTGHHWSWIATIILGLGHVVWIALELIYLPEPSWFHAIYGPLGLALMLLPLLPSVRVLLANPPATNEQSALSAAPV